MTTSQGSFDASGPAGSPPSGADGRPPVRVVQVTRRGALFWVAVVFAVLFFLSTVFFFLMFLVMGAATAGVVGGRVAGKFHERVLAGSGSEAVLVLPIEGVITGRPSSGFVSAMPSSVDFIREQLKQARESGNIRAVILRVDSPGGSVSACETIYQELDRYHQETGCPIVTYMDNTAASGGYYIACASEYIVAHPMTITGSIGVIVPWFGIHDLLGKIGVETESITAGDRKDLATASRPLSAEDRQVLQGIADEFHRHFRQIVADGFERRGLLTTAEQMGKLADGMIYTGAQAKEIGLVDETGRFEDAVRAAKKIAGLSQVRVITLEPRPGLIDLLSGNVESRRSAARFEAVPAGFTEGPGFMYLWTAGQGTLLSTARSLAMPRP